MHYDKISTREDISDLFPNIAHVDKRGRRKYLVRTKNDDKFLCHGKLRFFKFLKFNGHKISDLEAERIAPTNQATVKAFKTGAGE